MRAFPRVPAPHLGTALLTALFAWAIARFAWQPGLASLADDSVSYLVMAQVFSPWQAAAAPVAEAFVREAFYPPLFPLLLALSGAAHDIAFAHLVTALLLACWLPLSYLLAIHWLGGRWAALAATLALASLPTLWVQAKGVLSEPLFGALLLALFLAFERMEDGRAKRALVAALLAALVLTRSAALVAVAGYGLWAIARPGRDLRARAIAALPAVAAVAAYGVWVMLRPAGTSDDYLRIVAERSAAIVQASSVLPALGASIARQGLSMAEAWVGSLLIFWVEGSPVRPALAGALGFLALAGLALRFAAWKADAWMSAAYLATFLAWPFYDQMTRFLLPLVPVLLLYAFWACGEGARRLLRGPAAAQGVLALVVLSLTLPGLAFLQGRAKAGGRLAEITDWYRTPGLDEARRRARVQLDLMADLQEIRRLTGPQDRVMWVAPSYIALLAQRRGVPAPAAELGPEPYRRAVEQAAPDYVFLSVFHPRDTLRDAAWQAGFAALLGRAEVVQTRLRGEDGKVSSLLLRMPAAGEQAVIRESARYTAAAAVALGVDFGAYVGLMRFASVHYLVAAPIGFGLGLATIYLLSVRWVFRVRRFADRRMEFVLFALIGVAGLALNQAVIYSAVQFLSLSPEAAKVISAGIVFCFNFGLRKLLLFTRPA